MPESAEERKKRISRETSARYRAKNLEKARSQHRAYRAKNLDQIRKKDRDAKRRKKSKPRKKRKEPTPTKAEHQAAHRLRKKKREYDRVLDTWPYCHWQIFTSDPCRKKPTHRFHSSPMCLLHFTAAQKL